MSHLEQLKQAWASTLTKDAFLLDPRTAVDMLTLVERYTQQVPFIGINDTEWNQFWLGEQTPASLNAIYQTPTLAGKTLPVQQAFLLALLRLLETPTTLINTLPARHRSLYYLDLLGFFHGHDSLIR